MNGPVAIDEFAGQLGGKESTDIVTEDSAAVARLEAGRHVHTVTFAAGPDETSRIKPGTYQFRAVLDCVGRAQSNPCTKPCTSVVHARRPRVPIWMSDQLLLSRPGTKIGPELD